MYITFPFKCSVLSFTDSIRKKKKKHTHTHKKKKKKKKKKKRPQRMNEVVFIPLMIETSNFGHWNYHSREKI